ncbi:conserved hypothetical protein [Candidatus Terasakiella magnetica]|uniref:DUF3572 domain-containing protein n=1 Tax=Candidatus Terasakiella magnetica TaxID=1867952 RepID=A0A1C3RDH3_9PROT|nr:DUF3572 domain-containing protein [Candidatus Terasakiella magnetica]SCA55337.1 conserved hypothetical protein [Candidatus Terasakiella magnetica]
MKQEQAEVIALQAITFISSEERALHGFLAQSGAGIDDLQSNLTDPAFLAGILDFLLSDESALLVFCEQAEIEPQLIVSARRALPGAENLWDG